MKSPIILTLIAIILMSVVIGSGFYISTLKDDKQPTLSSQLTVNNLSAISNGTVTFQATLKEGNMSIIEAVFVNGTKYLWSEGSTQNSTILKGQSKTWTKNIENLIEGNAISVLLDATPKSANNTTIITKPNNSQPDLLDHYYDLYSGVELFDEGVFAIATSKNPLSQLPISSFDQSYWALIKQNITNTATNQEFISFLISRGNKPTGGYSLAIESFSWLESYPVKFRFQLNITDPGENVIVTQAITNPLVLVPIGKLSPGEYQIEVNVVWFIQNFDQQDNVEYQPVMTFKEIVYKQNLTITNPQGNIPTTTFKINVNQNIFSDLVLAVDLTQTLTKQTAQKITESIFIHVKGENTPHQLNTITYNNKEITANYTWGYNQEDMNHTFELKADLQNLIVEVNHCF